MTPRDFAEDAVNDVFGEFHQLTKHLKKIVSAIEISAHPAFETTIELPAKTFEALCAAGPHFGAADLRAGSIRINGIELRKSRTGDKI